MKDIQYEKTNLGKVVGDNGKSAYEIWLENGGEGDESEFLESLRGPSGAKIVKTEFVGIDNDGGYVYRQTFDDGSTAEFTAPRGPDTDFNIEQGNSYGSVKQSGNTVTDAEHVTNAAAFGSSNIANNREVFVHGFGNTGNGNFAHGEGFYNISHADISHTEGTGNLVGDLAQVAVRDTGEGGHAEGTGNHVLGKYAHAGGTGNVAKGDYSNSDGVGGNDWANPANSEIATTLTQFDEVQYIKNTAIGHGVSYTSSNNLTYISGGRFVSGTQAFSSFVSRIKPGDMVRVKNSTGLGQILTVHSKGSDYIYVTGKVEWQPNDSYIIVNAPIVEKISSGTAYGKGSSVSGLHNYAMQDYQRVIGKYNRNRSNTLFEVGNGTSNGNRKNAFEVLEDGRAKVQTTPQDPTDIVRLEDGDKLNPSIILKVLIDGVLNYVNVHSEESLLIQWGDGTFSSGNNNHHEYSKDGEYTIKIYGATEVFENMFSSNPSEILISAEMLSPIMRIQREAFSGCMSLEKVIFPRSLEWVEENAFQSTFMLKSVFYDGSPEEWIYVVINETGNEYLKSANRYFRYLPAKSESATTADNAYHIRLQEKNMTTVYAKENPMTGDFSVPSILFLDPGIYLCTFFHNGIKYDFGVINHSRAYTEVRGPLIPEKPESENGEADIHWFQLVYESEGLTIKRYTSKFQISTNWSNAETRLVLFKIGGPDPYESESSS